MQRQKQKEILGLNNTDTLNTRSTIALMLHGLGKNEEAYNIYQEVYQKQTEILGSNHSDTLETQFHMALVLDAQGKYEEVLNINRIIFEKIKNMSDTANAENAVHAQNNMAVLLCKQGKYAEALEIYKDVYEKKKLIFGVTHFETLRTLHGIAGVLCEQKKYSKALKVYQDVLDMQKVVLGPNHFDTLNTQYNIANVLFDQGKLIGALKAYKESFDQIKAFEPTPRVLNSLKQIKIIKLIFKLEANDISEMLQHLQKDINIAASNGDVQTVQRLLKSGASANDKDIDGRTPLHYAVSNRQIGVVNVLLKNEADITQGTNKRNTPLHIATSKGYKEIVEVLLEYVSRDKLNEFINAKTAASGSTSLHVAASNGYLEIVKSLLKHGATYNIENKEGKIPLDLSKYQSVTDLLQLVEELFKDAKKGNIEIISKLKAVNPDEFVAAMYTRNDQGNTLLQVTISNKHMNITSEMLKMLKLSNQNL
ncbi:Tankyrase-2 [Ooceraea biroi]|uniref:Tankyrase-2 n=1 Tax=Ooceraea biroi TaxID=2015173 RepID=A0A026VV38_OOCBI|nr:Tankyrase-2 [Ooceraea biroi]